MRLLEECVSKAEVVVLSDVGVPVEGFEELLRHGLEEGCPPLSSSCNTAVSVYRECVVERCDSLCRERFCSGNWCERGYWVCLASCTVDHGVQEAAQSIGELLMAGLV